MPPSRGEQVDTLLASMARGIVDRRYPNGPDVPFDDLYAKQEARLRAAYEQGDDGAWACVACGATRSPVSSEPCGACGEHAFVTNVRDVVRITENDNGTVSAVFLPERSFVYADQGKLDLGLVRRDTSDTGNRFQVFGESSRVLDQ